MNKEQLNEQLFDAIGDNNVNQVKNLIKAGADFNAVDDKRGTPLLWAAHLNRCDMAKILIANGAHINTFVEEENPLSQAISQNHTKMVRLLISEGAKINMKIGIWKSCLSYSLASFRIDIAIILIKGGADVNVVEQCGKTAFHFADKNGWAEPIIQQTVLCNPEATEPDYVTNNPKLSEHWGKCRDEVRGMQEEKIGNSNVSLHQILSEIDQDKLAGYLSNANTGVQEELKKDENIDRWKDAYPLHANEIESMITSQYNKGMERKDLLSKGEIVLKHSDFKVLSEDARNKVANFLTNTKLAEVRDAGILTLN